MARSLFLLLALPIAVSAWRCSLEPSVSYSGRGASKRPRPVWTSTLECCDGMYNREHARRSYVARGSGDDYAGPGGYGAEDAGKKKQEWPTDGRENLPFEVFDAAPPPRKVGVANLPPSTGTGDTLWHGAKHYKVLRVSNHYKYEGGRFVVQRKSIEAKELKRVAKERVVSRLVYGDGGRTPSLPPSPPSA